MFAIGASIMIKSIFRNRIVDKSLFKMYPNNFMRPRFSTVCNPSDKVNNIVWVDLEMTGLDPQKDHVLEVACLVTDSQLNIIAEGPDLAIHQPPEILTNMNEWCIKQHGESGLTYKCETSKVTLKDAEKQLVDFVREWAPFKKCPLGGNTIYMDRMFLIKHMPEFEQHMHYRIIDVSSIKELCRRWYTESLCLARLGNNNICTHRAMDDIKNSVAILKHYRDTIFIKPPPPPIGPLGSQRYFR